MAQLLGWETSERNRRSLERSLRAAHIGRFKSLAYFDWQWPTQCDRPALESSITLEFLQDATSVPSGVASYAI